ncbi:MAG: arginase [Saprospiraceae bacterium]|nr:arginase [Saprospiraceae bacterium]
MKRNISIIELAAEFGAGTRGASLGVDALRFACLNKQYDKYFELPSIYIEGDPERLVDRVSFPNAKRIDLILDVYERHIQRVKELIEEKYFPFVISGDHSNAAGTVAALKSQYPDKRLGVIWIDAHADLHTPYSSPSGNVHGMPVAAILNLTNENLAIRKPSKETIKHWETLCQIGGIAPKIAAEDLVFIGIRDLEEQEWNIIKQYNIQHFTNHDLNRLGSATVLEQTQQHLQECDLIYVSFDIDSLDKDLVPGTGTPVEDGLSFGQARDLLKGFWEMEKLVCLEFTEINPLLDVRNKTADIAADLFYELIK